MPEEPTIWDHIEEPENTVGRRLRSALRRGFSSSVNWVKADPLRAYVIVGILCCSLGAVACQREREKQDALLKVERARIYADYSKRAKQNWKNYQVLLSEKQARTCYHQDNVRTWNGDFSPRHKPEYVITCKVAVPGYHINTVVCDQDHCENKS